MYVRDWQLSLGIQLILPIEAAVSYYNKALAIDPNNVATLTSKASALDTHDKMDSSNNKRNSNSCRIYRSQFALPMIIQ